MSENKNTKLLGQGTWLTIGSSIITELVSNYPFEWLLFDMEHGYLTEDSLLGNLQATKNNEIAQIVRVSSLDPALIARILDRGVSGIMIPHVSTSKQAEECTGAMNYPPRGTRGFSGQARCFNYGLDTPEDIQSVDTPYLLVQIEDYEGVMNAEAIAQVEGVDVLFIGPSDLKLDLSTRDGLTLEFADAIKMVADAANKYQKQAGILVKDIEDIPYYLRLGIGCLAIDSDLGILRKGYESLTIQLKNL